jgi:hypothetical protein
MAVLRISACVLAFCAAALLQGGTEPKAAATEYPAHTMAGEVALGAEYLVHSFSAGGETFFSPDYLVVEVAVYPPKGREVQLSNGNFMLRVNGKKAMLLPEPAEFVATSLKYSDWEYQRTAEADIGVGGTDVILGRPIPSTRFPGDRRESERRRPPVTNAPDKVPGGVEKRQSLTPAEAAVESALPEGAWAKPAGGHLYFRYKGKTKSIKKLELVYQQGERQTVLPLL